MSSIIERIHRDFFSQYEKIHVDMSRAEQIRTDENMREATDRLSMAGFVRSRNAQLGDETVRTKLVSDYEMYRKYSIEAPAYKFITHTQLVELCKKYDLVWGDTGLFIGDIPNRNVQDIANFRVRPDLLEKKSTSVKWGEYKIESMDNTHLINTFIWICGAACQNTSWNTTIYGERINAHLVNVYAEMQKRFGISHSNNMFTSTGVCRSSRELRANGFLKVSEYVDPQSYMTKVHIDINTVLVPGLYDMLQPRAKDIPDSEFDISEVVFKVVANRELFDMTGMDVNGEHEIVPTPEPVRQPVSDFEDPIVLAKVHGGYLIVTAWGAEATYDNVYNYKNN